jgi:hypothetical protein
MSIRPIDIQVNIGRESDIKNNRVRDELHEEGAKRFINESKKEHQLKNETIQNLEQSNLEEIKEENKGKNKKKKEDKKKKKKEEENQFSDPTKGSIIDIKLS